MDSSQLTPEQRHQLLLAVADRRDYFAKLRDRMKATGWLQDDPLFVAVCGAWDAAHAVITALYVNGEKQSDPPPGWMRHHGPS